MPFKGMAGSTGLEPAASAVTGQRSNQLNYDPAMVVTGLAETLVNTGDSALSTCQLRPLSMSMTFFEVLRTVRDTRKTAVQEAG